MRSNIDAIVAFITRKDIEGGYVLDPQDPGGCTNHGITLSTYKQYVNPRATCQHVKDMPMADAIKIYRGKYWSPIHGDDLPHGIDLLIMDHGVNAGVLRANKLLQNALGVIPDGDIGPKTLQSLTRLCSTRDRTLYLITVIANRRRAYYQSLKTFNHFGRGWLTRVDKAEIEARKILQANWGVAL